MNKAKKILSTACALSMAASSAQGITAFAADIDYSIRDIVINGITLGEGQEKTVEEVKTAISALGEVNFENYATKVNDVVAIVESINRLSEEDKNGLQDKIDPNDDASETYWKTIIDASYIVEAGKTYDLFKKEIPNADVSKPATLTKTDYKNYYNAIENAHASYDKLTEGAQKMLADTAYLFKFEFVSEQFDALSTEEKNACVEALKKVVTNSEDITAEKYNENEAAYKDANAKFDALLPTQKSEIKNAIDGSDVLAKGAEALVEFKGATLENIKEGIAETITFENAADVNKSAKASKELYNTLISLDNSYVDAELAKDIDDYVKVSEYFVAVAATEEAGITETNYVSQKTAIDKLVSDGAAMDADQEGMAKAATEKADKLSTAWNDFKTDLVKKAMVAIDAIESFDSNTWYDGVSWQESSKKWKEIGEQIAAAETAVGKVVSYKSEVTNLDVLSETKERYTKINEDYKETLSYRTLVEDIGTVGDLATDDIRLDSEEKIKAAEDGYSKILTQEQKDLVSGEYATMQTARSEFDQLKAQKDTLDSAIADYNSAVSDFNILADKYDVTNDIATKLDTVKTAYDAAYGYANDTTYGNKLASFITADMTAEYNKVTDWANKIDTLRKNGEAVKTSGDALFAMLSIDADSKEADITKAIQDFAAEPANDLNALKDAIDDMSEKVLAYNESKASCEGTEGLGAVPNKAPYSEFAAYVNAYTIVNAEHEEINPSEAVKAVDAWANKVIALFNKVEDIDAGREVENEYKALKEQRDSFENYELTYAINKHTVALSNYIYVGKRIAEYQSAWAYMDKVTALSAEYDTLDGIRTSEGETAYNNAVCGAADKAQAMVDEYAAMLKAVKEISGVEDSFKEASELNKQLSARKAAYAFDTKVNAAIGDAPASDFVNAQKKYLDLWTDYQALTTLEKEFVTTTDALAENEAELVIAAINAIDAVSDYTKLEAAVKEANTCYDNVADTYKDLVTNADKLDEYTAVSELLTKIYNLANNLNESNMDASLQTAAALREEHDALNVEDKGAVKAKEAANEVLKDISVKIVSMKCAVLPNPDDVRAMTDKADLDNFGKTLEDVDTLYNALNKTEQIKVTGYARFEMDKTAYQEAVSAYNKKCTAEVDGLIEAIGYTTEEGTVTMTKDNYDDYAADITAAKTAYNALSDEQKSLLKNALVLDNAEKDYNSWKAAEQEVAGIKAEIANLEINVTKDNYKGIRKDYNKIIEAQKELSDKAKLLVTEAENQKLYSVDKNLKYVEAYMEVVDLIDEKIIKSKVSDNIINNEAIDMEYALIIAEIEAKYNELEVAQKLEVENYSALKLAREAYDKNVDNAIALIQESIDAIDMNAIVKDAETAKNFANIESMINSLSDENKNKIGADEEDTEYKDRLTKFAAAQKKYDVLKTSAEVMNMIKALGNPEELTEANLEASKAAVKEADDAYSMLAETEKVNVENYAALKNWKEAIDNFFVDHSGDINNDGEVDIDDIYSMIQFALGRKTPTDEEFERANIVKASKGETEEIDIFDVLAAIDLIEF